MPRRRKLPMSPDDLLEAGFLIYLQGLGFTAKALGRFFCADLLTAAGGWAIYVNVTYIHMRGCYGYRCKD